MQENPVVERGSLPFLVDSLLSVERLRVAVQVRQSHLKLSSRKDDDTDIVLEKLQAIEEFIEDRIATRLKDHPAQPWFSLVKGIGQENIAKVVGLVDITKANTVSGLWKFSGFDVQEGKAPKREAGKKLTYNSQLRSMCWRLGGAILKAGLRQHCVQCDVKRPVKVEGEELVCPTCGGKEFKSQPETKFAAYYVKQKANYVEKYERQGRKIVKAIELPKEKGKRYESADVISEGHVHSQALRKMIKLFLSCLWQVWREKEGLPTRQPYAMEYLGHTNLIDPWQMVDKLVKKSRAKAADEDKSATGAVAA